MILQYCKVFWTVNHIEHCKNTVLETEQTVLFFGINIVPLVILQRQNALILQPYKAVLSASTYGKNQSKGLMITVSMPWKKTSWRHVQIVTAAHINHA